MAETEKFGKFKFLAKLGPNARAAAVIGGLAGLVIIIAIILAPKGSVMGSSVRPNESTFAIAQNKDTSNEKIASDQLAAQKRLIEQGDAIDKIKLENQQLKADASKPSAMDANFQDQLKKLESELATLRKEQVLSLNNQLPPPINNAPSIASNIPLPLEVPPPITEVSKIRIIGGTNEKAKNYKNSAKILPKAYLPAGTFFEAVLLNGMDAPTNPVAIKNPVPALARIKTDAMLPNLFKHDIKECFVLMAGYGSLASERVVLRLESLSCTAEDGRVIESKLDGYVVGEDGRVGMRGRLVSKQGQLIAQSLTAGIFAGFGESLTPTATPGLNLNAGTSYAMPSAGAIVGTAVGKGFSDASTSASKFYLEMASQMTPIVEVDAGRKVTLILTKGIEVQ